MADQDSEKERDARLRENYKKNSAYAKKGDYQTQLNPASEAKFRSWLKANKVPFDPKSKVSDYDMRGFWLALQAKDPKAMTAINPNDKQLHYPDHWKTPYHQSFSNESQWATKGAPSWNKKDQLVLPDGKVVFDERARPATAPPASTPLPNPTLAVPTGAPKASGAMSDKEILSLLRAAQIQIQTDKNPAAAKEDHSRLNDLTKEIEQRVANTPEAAPSANGGK
jgi:hypothetical protein